MFQGEEGVTAVFQMLSHELKIAMALAGWLTNHHREEYVVFVPCFIFLSRQLCKTDTWGLVRLCGFDLESVSMLMTICYAYLLSWILMFFFFVLGCASLTDITPSLVMRHPPSHL